MREVSFKRSCKAVQTYQKVQLLLLGWAVLACPVKLAEAIDIQYYPSHGL